MAANSGQSLGESIVNLQPVTPLLRLTTGPLDELQLIDTDEACPKCGAMLMRVPLQEGRCHSGLFATRVIREHFWCDECADNYVLADNGDAGT